MSFRVAIATVVLWVIALPSFAQGGPVPGTVLPPGITFGPFPITPAPAAPTAPAAPAAPTPSLATDPALRNLIDLVFIDRLRGWDGIVFRCYVPEPETWPSQICARAVTHAAFLASVANVPFFDCRQCEAYQAITGAYDAGIVDPIELALRVSTTTGDMIGGLVSLRAEHYFWGAIEGIGIPTPAEAMPRDGVMVLWDWSTAFSCYRCTGESLVSDLGPLVELRLTEFLTLFNRGRQPD